jgi:hypothetical protein
VRAARRLWISGSRVGESLGRIWAARARGFVGSHGESVVRAEQGHLHGPVRMAQALQPYGCVVGTAADGWAQELARGRAIFPGLLL